MEKNAVVVVDDGEKRREGEGETWGGALRSFVIIHCVGGGWGEWEREQRSERKKRGGRG